MIFGDFWINSYRDREVKDRFFDFSMISLYRNRILEHRKKNRFLRANLIDYRKIHLKSTSLRFAVFYSNSVAVKFTMSDLNTIYNLLLS